LNKKTLIKIYHYGRICHSVTDIVKGRSSGDSLLRDVDSPRHAANAISYLSDRGRGRGVGSGRSSTQAGNVLKTIDVGT